MATLKKVNDIVQICALIDGKKVVVTEEAMATLKKVNDIVQICALIDGKKVVVTEEVIRQDLRLDEADGVECLPNEEIFIELARMGYEKPPPKLTFFTRRSSLYNGSRKFNFSKYIFDSMVQNVDSPTKILMYTSPALTQKVFANMKRVEKGFSGVETPLFASTLVQPQAAEEEDEIKVPTDHAPPSPTPVLSPPP
nr:hypothetical protein [Tanacetum cinerariifolium]